MCNDGGVVIRLFEAVMMGRWWCDCMGCIVLWECHDCEGV